MRSGNGNIVSGKLWRVTLIGNIPPGEDLDGEELKAFLVSCVSVNMNLSAMLRSIQVDIGREGPADIHNSIGKG